MLRVGFFICVGQADLDRGICLNISDDYFARWLSFWKELKLEVLRNVCQDLVILPAVTELFVQLFTRRYDVKKPGLLPRFSPFQLIQPSFKAFFITILAVMILADIIEGYKCVCDLSVSPKSSFCEMIEHACMGFLPLVDNCWPITIIGGGCALETPALVVDAVLDTGCLLLRFVFSNSLPCRCLILRFGVNVQTRANVKEASRSRRPSYYFIYQFCSLPTGAACSRLGFIFIDTLVIADQLVRLL